MMRRSWITGPKHRIDITLSSGSIGLLPTYDHHIPDLHLLTPEQARGVAEHLRACADQIETRTATPKETDMSKNIPPRDTAINELRALIAQVKTETAAASPGPWRVESEGYQSIVLGQPLNEGTVDEDHQLISGDPLTADAHLIATARTALPVLTAALENVFKAIELAESDARGWAKNNDAEHCYGNYIPGSIHTGDLRNAIAASMTNPEG